MEKTKDMEQVQIRVEDKEMNSSDSRISKAANFLHQYPILKKYGWWFRITLYINFLLAGQSAATLLGRLYFDNGGNSIWIATLVESAGFPVIIPLRFIFPLSSNSTTIANTSSNNDPLPRRKPSKTTLFLLFLFFGVFLAGDNLLYSYGLQDLPVSTYSLICATQLAFNALFSFLLNSQKFTALIFNSLVLLTVSASLLAVHPDSDNGSSTKVSKGKYIIGFICTVGASAMYSLQLSLIELSFKKVIKRETFDAILDMQIWPSFVASCICVVGLFASGEWKKLPKELEGYEKSSLSYFMTLIWTAISWQISSMGLLGLIFEVSSLFSNVISTISLPAIPILAVIFFHDKMDGVKVIALILAIWGFLSYIYQNYLDDAKSRKFAANEDASLSLVEIKD
ncbi:OLC1v1031499C1 [Oldenlandia corymbosa var. corymbosa]|uniref:Probable purine permease n=1 Tax=Oldenlandia corymbosa var. corymbosa TaxID=529605 RepID=A0AAV1CIH4_OLDCO|nr:OLC1v1031499C1 [Oldenlandia corymbosa var. corymbosa]